MLTPISTRGFRPHCRYFTLTLSFLPSPMANLAVLRSTSSRRYLFCLATALHGILLFVLHFVLDPDIRRSFYTSQNTSQVRDEFSLLH